MVTPAGVCLNRRQTLSAIKFVVPPFGGSGPVGPQLKVKPRFSAKRRRYERVVFLQINFFIQQNNFRPGCNAQLLFCVYLLARLNLPDAKVMETKQVFRRNN
jgi:hypothetical protein